MWIINHERGSQCRCRKKCCDGNCAVNTCGMDEEAENVCGGPLVHKDDMSASLHVLIFLKHNTEKMAAHQKKQKAMLMRRATENK